ncbi:MAG: ribonuclease III [Patescibacteria group bacterium]
MKQIDFSRFEDSIGVSFSDKALLKQAFTHRSYLNENPRERLSHNERLEFLGDAVLELIATEYLFKKYPDKNEGELTAYRAALVNTITLSETAQSMNINEFLLLSRGEQRDTGKARQYILANTFEAFVGALYLDKGYAVVEKILYKILFPRLEKILSERSWQDAKSRFQEKAQEVLSITPAYKVLKEMGPDHDKTFVVGVFLGDTKIAEGSGRSKQDAEQDAARAGLSLKDWEK